MTISSEDIEKADKFYDILNRGYLCSSSEVTQLYNKLTGKNVSNTNCSTCIRHRVLEMHSLVDRIKKESDAKETSVNQGDKAV